MGRKASYDDLDNVMDTLSSLEEREKRESGIGADERAGSTAKAVIGEVEHYYSKLGVAAIRLTGTLKAGDLIEIGSEDEEIRQRVASMQINREDVEEASAGQSIGIKVKHPVSAGSNVYRL